MGCYKKNEALQVNYLALNKTTGLTDVTMYVYNPSDVLTNTITMTEVVAGSGFDALGLYRGTFTPNVDGQWRIRIQSDTNNDDISKIFEIGNYKLDDVKDQTQDIEDKVDIIDGNVDQTLLDVAAVKGVVDSTETKVDAIKTETDKIQTIDDNVDSVKTTVEATASDVTAIKTKTDNLPADTASEISSMQAKLDDIQAATNLGGYILN